VKRISKLVSRFDNYQQKRGLLSFIVAVIKKYDDDQGGRQAALLTYYSFLSLFPLFLVLTTVTDSIIGKNSALRNTIVKGLTNYFPLLGQQLSNHVHELHAFSPTLIIGLLFTLYGTRGVANSFINGVQDIWLVPKNERTGFPKSLIKSFSVVLIGGSGLLLASIIASLTYSAGHDILFRIIAVVVNLLLLIALFSFLLNLSLPKHVTVREVRAGAITAAVGLLCVQLLGSYILAHELKHLSALYSYFAVALALLFWVYLQSQVLYYSIEVAYVKSNNLWPKSIFARAIRL
jgi:YihY family inner membrane protein